MQAVGIALSSALSALGTQPQQKLAQILCSEQQTLTQRDDFIARPVWVGAYQGTLYNEPLHDLAVLDSRNLRFALTALQLIEAPLRQMTQGIASHRLAIVLGTSTSGIGDNQQELERQIYAQQPLKLGYAKQAMSALALGVQRYLGWTGIAYTISTACSSSAKAFAVGQRLLNSDLADVVLVGGVDTLCKLTLNGFNSLESLSAGICQPCGTQRDGINIGEASALFVLHREKAPVMLLSSGESMDAWHISAPHPEGLGALRAMERALQSAELSITDIDYLNMHGTATPQNDAMEIKAIKQLSAVAHPKIWVSSTKHKTGHCLGAAAAIEAYICQQILSSDTPWLPYHQQGILDETLTDIAYVSPMSMIQPVSYVMSNSFAFGGSNMSLIFART